MPFFLQMEGSLMDKSVIDYDYLIRQIQRNQHYELLCHNKIYLYIVQDFLPH